MGSAKADAMAVGVAVRPVVALLDELVALVDGLDPGQLPGLDAFELVSVLDRMGRVADAGKMTAAVRVGETSLWRRSGARSAADWLAKVTGVGVGDAVRLLRTAEAVGSTAQTRDALNVGEVSPRQATALAKVEHVDPVKAADMLATASKVSVAELETEANRFLAARSAESDGQKAERHRKARRLRTGIGDDGMGWGSWRLPPLDHARLLAQLEAAQDDVFHAARRGGTHEASEAYAADALMTVVGRAERTAGRAADDPVCRVGATTAEVTGPGREEAPGSGRVTDDWSFAKVIVRVDATALDRGELEPGEVCEIAGKGPIPVAEAWKIIDGQALVAVLSTRGSDIDKVVHLGRRPTELQRTALDWRHAAECGIDGCTSQARLEIDHVADWADTHRTELSQLAGPCGHHHDLKTHRGYTFGPVLPNGKRRLIPPVDAGPPGTGPDADTDAGPPDEHRFDAAADRAADPLEEPRRSSQGDLFDTG